MYQLQLKISQENSIRYNMSVVVYTVVISLILTGVCMAALHWSYPRAFHLPTRSSIVTHPSRGKGSHYTRDLGKWTWRKK